MTEQALREIRERVEELRTLAQTARAVCKLDNLDVALVKKRWLIAVADTAEAMVEVAHPTKSGGEQ